ncbi:MAG: hypothetical protein R2762_28375 [Bryobacteraceae bacterium]
MRGDLSLKALARLGAAGAAAVAAAAVASPELAPAATAFASVAGSYLTNRANSIEDADEERIQASKNHHLQIAIAGALRLALDELARAHPNHKDAFAAWDTLIEAALDDPVHLLPGVIPIDFDPLLDAANPHADRTAATGEIEPLLRYWLALEKTRQQTGSYPSTPPTSLPALPADLTDALHKAFLPEYEKAFANLLGGDAHTHARRAFARRTQQELLARSRRHSQILQRLEDRDRLPLTNPKAHAYDAARELEILRAENRAIPVLGRQSDLESLHAWLASTPPVSLRILTGPAGAGKTRLALQLLDEIDRTQWYAGLLRDLDAVSHLDQRYWDRPTLAIIDYAATVAAPLKSWLGRIADASGLPPIRILLLEREAAHGSGWLSRLADQSYEGGRIAALMDPPDPQRITPIEDAALRRGILSATLARLAAPNALPPPGEDPIFDRRLAEPRWQDPLYLMMAALVAREPGKLPEALSLSRADLAFRLADRELARIRRFAGPAAQDSAGLLTHLAGLVTACRTLEQSELNETAKEESAALGYAYPGGPHVAADKVAEALRRNGRLAPIEPDMIGEAVLLRCFGGAGLEEGMQALVRAARRSGNRHAAPVCFAITRTCQDFATDLLQDPLDWVEEFIRTGDSDDAGY